MFYRLEDRDTSLQDWIALNTNQIDGDLIVRAFSDPAEATDAIVWVNPPEPEDGYDDPPALHGGFMPAWRWVWTCAEDDPRTEIRAALDAAGFDLFEIHDPDHPIEWFWGVDGGGYSFYGAHWYPLRAHLLAKRIEWWIDQSPETAAGKAAGWRELAEQWCRESDREGDDLRRKVPVLFEVIERCERFAA